MTSPREESPGQGSTEAEGLTAGSTGALDGAAAAGSLGAVGGATAGGDDLVPTEAPDPTVGPD